MAMKELKKIDVVTFAVVLGLVYAVFGLIFGVFAAIGGAGMAFLPGMAAAGLAVGALSIIVFPIMMFIMGFIGGAIFAAIYNFVAQKYSGIKIDLV